MSSTNGEVIGMIGTAISCGLFLSPAPTFITIFKRKDVEQFSPNPYLAAILNCALWIFYGLPFVQFHSYMIVTINGVGLVLEFIYIFIYLKFSDSKQRSHVFKVLASELVVMIGIVCVTIVVAQDILSRSSVVRFLCSVSNICMYAMPLDVMVLVIKTKSVEYLPFYLTLAIFFNGLIWLGYALLYLDLNMTISNGSGAALGFIQLLLHAKYWRTTPNRDAKLQCEVQLSSNLV